MAYTNVWDNTAPLGSQAANLIDDDFRAFKLDIGERLTSIFGIGTLNALDPVAPLLLRLTGAVASRIIPGATSLSLRNNADSADNLLIVDNGNITTRGGAGIGNSNYALQVVASQGQLILQSTGGGSVGWTLSANTSDRLTLTRIGGSQIFSVDPSGPITVGFNLIVSSGGIAVTGTSSITGSLLVNAIAANSSIEIRSTTSGNKRSLFYTTNGSLRWEAQTTNTAEGGAQSGSDYVISRYSDAGAFIDNPFQIIRSNGNVNVANALNLTSGDITTTNGDLNLNGTGSTRQIVINANAGQVKRIQFRSANSARWEVNSDGTAESGGNAGSNFVIARSNDAGATIDSPFTIIRSDGQVQININASPALKVSKNSSTNNFFVGLVNTEASGKDWRFVIDTVANGGNLGFWNFTDSVYGLQISPAAVVTIGAQTAYPSAKFTDGSNTLELGWTGNTFFLKQTQATDRILSFRNHSNQDILLVNYSTGVVTAGIGPYDTATGYRIGNAAASGNYLRGNGTNFVASALLAGDLPSALTPTTLVVGGGSTLSKLLTGSLTTTPNGGASIGAGASISLSITVTGASAGDDVFVSSPWTADDSRLACVGAYVSAANTVLVTLANIGTVGSNLPTNRTIKAWVLA